MKITIKDVAREANVSTSTVSRVLSDSDKISKDTKDRVHLAIKKLNYVPNPIARGLANKKTNIIAVIVPEKAEALFQNQFFIEVMKGMSICAEEEDYYIMYVFKEDKYDDNRHLRKFINSNLVDGICLFRAEEEDKSIEYLKNIDFPFVVVGRPNDIKDILWVDNDNFKTMYDLVNFLIKNGHKKIGLVGAKLNLSVSVDRLRGYKEALKDNGIEVDKKIIYLGENFNSNTGMLGAKKIINEKEDVTAIVALDDLIAFGIQDYINMINRKDISIVGFNNLPLSAHRNPALASIDINSEKLGYYAAKLLINKLKGINEVRCYLVETKLIIRSSLKKIGNIQ